MDVSVKLLDAVFGEESVGATPEDRARSSNRLFVRSQDHLAPYRPEATGRVFRAWEALDAFGFDMLAQAVFDDPAILVSDPNEPALSLRNRRLEIGLDIADIARFTDLPVEIIEKAENPQERSQIRDLERIAMALGLDERLIAVEPGAGGDVALAVRLRSLSAGAARLTPPTVLTLDEAAWVIETQDRLQEWLSIEEKWREFEPSPNYGWAGSPVWEQGYFLARKTRELLGIPYDAPIPSLRELCDVELGIPFVQVKMPPRIAGATVANGSSRGIAINLEGYNSNVWVRRATIAHELGHLLWDPDQKLRSLAVDEYVDLENAWKAVDRVEQRANAFAAEFLAPQMAVLSLFQAAESYEQGLRTVMETYGVSYSVARYQVWNASDRKLGYDALKVEFTEATGDWDGREAYTVDYFPIADVPITRRGEFAGAVVVAEESALISVDTACQYLRCSEIDYLQNRERIAELFPSWSDDGEE